MSEKNPRVTCNPALQVRFNLFGCKLAYFLRIDYPAANLKLVCKLDLAKEAPPVGLEKPAEQDLAFDGPKDDELEPDLKVR